MKQRIERNEEKDEKKRKIEAGELPPPKRGRPPKVRAEIKEAPCGTEGPGGSDPPKRERRERKEATLKELPVEVADEQHEQVVQKANRKQKLDDPAAEPQLKKRRPEEASVQDEREEPGAAPRTSKPLKKPASKQERDDETGLRQPKRQRPEKQASKAKSGDRDIELGEKKEKEKKKVGEAQVKGSDESRDGQGAGSASSGVVSERPAVSAKEKRRQKAMLAFEKLKDLKPRVQEQMMVPEHFKAMSWTSTCLEPSASSIGVVLYAESFYVSKAQVPEKLQPFLKAGVQIHSCLNLGRAFRPVR